MSITHKHHFEAIYTYVSCLFFVIWTTTDKQHYAQRRGIIFGQERPIRSRGGQPRNRHEKPFQTSVSQIIPEYV